MNDLKFYRELLIFFDRHNCGEGSNAKGFRQRILQVIMDLEKKTDSDNSIN